MSAQKPLISVVVPTHNRSDALAKTLVNLAAQKFAEPWEVIVVNNRCTDDTDEVVQRQAFPVPLRLIHRADVPGAAAARNAGAEVANGDYLLFMDNDILVDPDFVERHRNSLVAHPGCWIVGQIVNLPEQERTPFGRFRRALFPYNPPSLILQEAHGLTGQSSLPRADFVRLEGFDERFDVASVEDIELAMRAWRLKIKILYDPSIVGVHNDWAGFTIRDYCRRQRTYTHCEPLLWQKYGKDHLKQRLVQENLPPLWRQDKPVLLVRKMLKQLAGTPFIQSILFAVCDVLERVCPWPPILWRLYLLLLAGAIYRGFQEGLSIHRIKLKRNRLLVKDAFDQ
jgi:glycosyltransferase involved in cell wall biosynthesis